MKYADLSLQESYVQNEKENKEKTGGLAGIIIVVLVLTVIIGGLYLFRDKIKDAFNPISIVGSVTKTNLKETDGRTNILLLGSDKRDVGSVTSTLTDTILIASIGKVDHDVVLISVPRDFWVKWTDTSGQERFSKINAIYPSVGGGIEPLKSTIQETLGVPIHYYSLVTFDLFKEVINILGGIDVTVDNAFTDKYFPVEGKEEAPDNERYQTITFNTGKQTMDGETALKFVRSRHGDGNEGTDFARSKRQQKVIMAIKDKMLTAQTLLNPDKLKELYDAYAKNVDTNIDFGTVQSFYLLSQQIDFSKVISVVLDDRSDAIDGGLLYAPEDTTLYGGQYVLVPRTGDYSQIHAFVQKYLFGDR
jgi:polyisoprenyl-teichoic acid--peptidoglycan teichoic acid transferase